MLDISKEFKKLEIESKELFKSLENVKVTKTCDEMLAELKELEKKYN